MVPERNYHSGVANAQMFDPGEGDLVGLDKDYMADEVANKMNISDFNCPEELTNRTDPLVQMVSITPAQGPTTGKCKHFELIYIRR